MRNLFRQVLTLAFVLIGSVAMAQTGKIFGKVIDSKTKEALPFAAVQIYQGNNSQAQMLTDLEGEFKTGPLNPGNYDVHVSTVGYKKVILRGVTVSTDQTVRLMFDKVIALEEAVVTKGAIEVVEIIYKKPILPPIDGGLKNIKTADDIAKAPTRDITAIIASGSNVVASDVGGSLSVRGSRPGDQAYYVNGMRQPAGSLPPPEAIEEISTIVGGVPAQYGDALGGVINITTKSAPKKFRGSVQLETDAPFHPYGYNLAAASLSGPLVKIADGDTNNLGGNGNNKRTLLGFYATAQFSDIKDGSPSAVGYWQATDATRDALRANPVRLNPNGTGYLPNANFLGPDAFQKQYFNPGNYRSQSQGNFNLDFAPFKNSLFTVGGNYTYSQARISGAGNLFNYSRAPLATSYTWNAFARFQQNFGQGNTGLIKNIFYRLQADINRTGSWVQDAEHGANVSRYDYIGTFRDSLGDVTVLPGNSRTFARFDPTTGTVDSNFTLASNANTTVVLKNQQLGLIFNGGQYNRDMVGYNNFIFGQNPLFLQSATTADIQSGFLFSRGVGLNGIGVPSYGYAFPGNSAVGGFMSAIGDNLSGFNKSINDQVSFTAQAGVDIGNHSIRAGIELQQRFIASYSGATAGLWTRGRNLLNQQFTGNQIIDTIARIDPNTGRRTLEVYFQDHVVRNGNTDRAVGQSDFDYNLRRALGMNTLGNNRINLDEVNPDVLNIGLFSVSNILDQAGAPLASWTGYDPYGRNTGELFATKTDWYSFFRDTVNRPITAFRPQYFGGYIEDKYEIDNLTLRFGLRFERYDINQPVLKDRYSFVNTLKAGETDFSQFGGNFTKPDNIGNDYVVYVDKDAASYDGTAASQRSFRVVGFRSGNQFYNASGIETSNFNDIAIGGQLNPWFNVSNVRNDAILGPLATQRRVTLDAFQDFQARWLVLPRLSLSFPINENSSFFAYYDQLAQRPLSFGGGLNATTPLNYYAAALQGNGINPTIGAQGQYIANPDLQPQTKIDYAAGFQQKIASNMAIRVNAYYSEIKDLIQIIRINGGYPNSYLTDGNQDFSVNRGASIEFDYRNPTGKSGIQFDASYTLQFAETSASNFAAGQLQNTANPNLRTTVPYAIDPRHAFKFNFDYRIVDGDGPSIGSWKPFQNMGINMQWVALSGNPYTRFAPNYFTNQVTGTINGSRLPWNFRADLRIEKAWEIESKGDQKTLHRINAYVYITNLFDIRNIQGVYPKSGTPTDDGYLNSDLARQQAAIQQAAGNSAAAYNNYYNMLVMNGNLYTLPRWVRIGVNYSF